MSIKSYLASRYTCHKWLFILITVSLPTLATGSSSEGVLSPPSEGPSKTIKLSPKIHEIPLKKSIGNIPLEKINTFLSNNRVVTAEQLEEAPYVVGAKDERVIFSAGFDIYVRGKLLENINQYGIYRGGYEYKDPDTQEILGIQAVDIGNARLKSIQQGISTLTIVDSNEEVRVGDRLLPSSNQLLTSLFTPVAAVTQKKGVIMAVERGISQAGRLDVITLNLGEHDDLSQGSLLGIFKKGDAIEDRHAQLKENRQISLPDERAGLVMVFKTFPKMSMGIILEAEEGIRLGDIVAAP